MSPSDSVQEALVSHSDNGPSTITLAAAVLSLGWYITVVVVCLLGHVQIFRYYSKPPEPVLPTGKAEEPEVTIIRPVKGLEPYLYDCLASTFHQIYSESKVHIRVCVSSRDDPAFPILQRLVYEYDTSFDVQILVEDEDDMVQSGQLQLGPNPKIRNMSRAYREAPRSKGDIIWIVDCNVWIGTQTLSRMVSTLSANKFVHQLPLTVDTSNAPLSSDKRRTHATSWWSLGGSRLDEMYLSTYHAKFYVAINTVLIAPASVGKSTMFRAIDLDSLTDGQGIDYFSYNICEDHLIGDLLWKQKVPAEKAGTKLGKHAVCFGDLAIQPVADVSVGEYWNKRVRWLRVRKFTVTLATLVEPGTESFSCSLYGAFAFTTIPFFHSRFGIPPTWSAFFAFWLLSVTIWCAMDWALYRKLQSGASIWISHMSRVPDFVKPIKDGKRRPFHEWLFAWLGREALAVPLWLWAIYGGTTVEWRGKKFWVGMDMRVHEIADDVRTPEMNGFEAVANGKYRKD